MGHLVIMAKQSTVDRFLPLYDFIANTRWGFDILLWGVCLCFVLSEFITIKLHVCFLHLKACHSPGTLIRIEV